jgi:hypothetical protein
MGKTGYGTSVTAGVGTGVVGTGDVGWGVPPSGETVVQPATSTRSAAQPNNRILFIIMPRTENQLRNNS